MKETKTALKMSSSKEKKDRKGHIDRPGKGRIVFYVVICTVLLLAGTFLIYTGNYYRADNKAMEALVSDETVEVSEEDYGHLFDGPSEAKVLIFYPGAKVEDKAYAPLLRQIAEEAMDVCLVRMPFHLAIFGVNKAAAVIGKYDYEEVYVGGHSLGGAMAAEFAAENPDDLDGVIMFAAYPTKKIPEDLSEISIYGSEDGVLNSEKYEAGKELAPADFSELVIEGGNHAGFGSYGDQKGDGAARITAEDQQEQAAEFIRLQLEKD